QLAQRITARYHLTPLDRDETEAYVRHRLAIAGALRSPFSRLGLRALYKRSGGVPRLINVIGDRALMAGYAREQNSIGERLVDRAADETLPGTTRYRLRHYGPWAAAACAVIALGAAAYFHQLQKPVPAPTPTAPPPPVAPAAASGAATTTAAAAEPAKPQENPAGKKLAALVENAADSELTAWTQLLARWQATSAETSVRDAARCHAVVFPGMNCLRGHGAITQLARFDRPLILPIKAQNASAYALLQGAAGDQVQLNLGGESFRVGKDDLASVWDGEFLALWRLPADVPARLRSGDAGPGVAWVKAQLARMDGGAADAGPAFFDDALAERVRKLQTAYGIKPDGIVGPETLFALSALDPGGPHLTRSVQ
ncbi:MAG TPA: peptidoglycan-binding protein, partial [Burkholderiaceae bacterium]|nr:peptidoglycan-binding protein [Burkholderiaceae bacterium]